MFPDPDSVQSRTQREGEAVTNRRVRQQTAMELVDTKAIKLDPMKGPLKKGHHAAIGAELSGLQTEVGVTLDSGAQVPAISLACASVAWRGQDSKIKELEQLGESTVRPRAFTGCERMTSPQKFFWFKGPRHDRTTKHLGKRDMMQLFPL